MTKSSKHDQSNRERQEGVSVIAPFWDLNGDGEQHIADEQFLRGLAYELGLVVRRDIDEAVKRYRVAAEHGFAIAQHRLGVMYNEGEGVPQDHAEAAKWIRRSADQGLASAQYRLGLMYLGGKGVPQDIVEGVRWTRLAAEKGYAYAQFKLGVMHPKGGGVPHDDAEGVRLIRLAVDKGLAEAQYFLGVMYAQGRGVRQDNTEAVKLARLAANQSRDLECEEFVDTYLNRRITLPNVGTEKARRTQLEAGQGGALPQYFLGLMYANGWGVPLDEAEAMKWYQRAIGVVSH